MLKRLRRTYGQWRFLRRFDTFVCAYPKTGNTWTRVFLGRYVQALRSLPEMPLFDLPPDGGRMDVPAILFTHAPLEWDVQQARHLSYRSVVAPFVHGKVVVLARHPLDTLLSSFMQVKHQDTGLSFEGGFGDFVEDPVWGLEKLIRYYELWADHRHKACGFLLQRYEDARAAPAPTFRRLIDYLEMPFDNAAFEDALGYSEFSNMQALDRADTGPVYKSSGYSIFASNRLAGPDGLHVRRGEIGGYVDHLDEPHRIRLEATVRRSMPPLYGYR
jgi:hypothetical protein